MLGVSDSDEEQAAPTPKLGAAPSPIFRMLLEEQERAEEEDARRNQVLSRDALEEQKRKLHTDIDVLVGLAQSSGFRLASVLPGAAVVEAVVVSLVPMQLALVGCVALMGDLGWELGACLCGASALLVLGGVLWTRGWESWDLGGWRGKVGAVALVALPLAGAVLVWQGLHQWGGVALLALLPASALCPKVVWGDSATQGAATTLFLLCSLCATALLLAGHGFVTAGTVLGAVAGPLVVLAMVGAVVDRARDSDLAARLVYESLKKEASIQLDSVNLLVDQTKARIKREHSGMAQIVAIPSSVEGPPGTHIRQPLPLWWYVAAPVRTLGIVVAGLVFALPDFLRLPIGDQHSALWQAMANTSVLYKGFVRPWIGLLVGRFIRDATAATTVLNSQLDFAQNHLGEGVEFIPVAVKRRARAMVKVRDDYLREVLPASRLPLHSALDRLARLFQSSLQGLVHKSKTGELTWKQRRLPGWMAGAVRTAVRLLVLAAMLGGVALFLPTFLVLWAAVLVEHSLAAMALYSWHVGASTSQLVDVSRGMLVCEAPEDMARVDDHLRNHEHHRGVWEVVRVKNGWADEGARGYAHLMYNVRLRDTGVVCEVQVTLREVFDWRKFTHLPYVVLRAEGMHGLVQDVQGKKH